MSNQPAHAWPCPRSAWRDLNFSCRGFLREMDWRESARSPENFAAMSEASVAAGVAQSVATGVVSSSTSSNLLQWLPGCMGFRCDLSQTPCHGGTPLPQGLALCPVPVQCGPFEKRRKGITRRPRCILARSVRCRHTLAPCLTFNAAAAGKGPLCFKGQVHQLGHDWCCNSTPAGIN